MAAIEKFVILIPAATVVVGFEFVDGASRGLLGEVEGAPGVRVMSELRPECDGPLDPFIGNLIDGGTIEMFGEIILLWRRWWLSLKCFKLVVALLSY